jgi:hypothetical protein
LPKKLAVGENFDLLFPYEADTFLSHPLEAIGVNDSFHHQHWAPARDFRIALEKYEKDFPQ